MFSDERAGDGGEGIPLVDVEMVEPSIAQTTIAVEGMTCGACTSAIEGSLVLVWWLRGREGG